MPQSQEQLAGRHLRPELLVREALATGCKSLAYTYTEPTIYFEMMCAVAALGKEQGLLNLMVSNGFLTAAARDRLKPLIDGANIDLKAWSNSFYRRLCGAASMTPVLETIADFAAHGVWVEVTTLLIPGYNDSVSELRELARFLVSISPAIPWHVTGFFPTYRLTEVAPTPPETINRAHDIGREAGLHYVFAGNRPGIGGESTYCHNCGELLIERYGFRVLKNRISGQSCPACQTQVAGIF
jgi:pyruvate formate lyase activating enzyme